MKTTISVGLTNYNKAKLDRLSKALKVSRGAVLCYLINNLTEEKITEAIGSRLKNAGSKADNSIAHRTSFQAEPESVIKLIGISDRAGLPRDLVVQVAIEVGEEPKNDTN